MESPLNILIVGDYPRDPRLGSAKVPLKLADEFVRLGHKCTTLFFTEIGSPGMPGRMRQLFGPMLALRAIRQWERMAGPFDVVDIASAEGFHFGIARRLGWKRRMGFVSRSNGLEHLNYQRLLDDHAAGLAPKPWHKRIWFPLARCRQVAGAAKLCNRLILINEKDRQFALERKWKKPEEIVVVQHGVSNRFLESVPDSGAKRGAGLLYCGTWTGVKGTDYLALALNELAAANALPPTTLLGPSVPEEVVRAALSPEANKQVRIVPRASEEEVIQAYREHDVLVFPSTYEGFGMVLVEAMSQGLAVISTPVGAATTLIKEGENGLLVPARNPGAIAAAVERLFADEALRRRIGSRAAESVRHLSWDRTARQTIDVYRQAIQHAAKHS